MLPIYRFEQIGEDLELVPLAGRRALDAAGRKVALLEWRALPHDARQLIVDAGGHEVVDVEAVRSALGSSEGAPISTTPEPSRDALPDALAGKGLSLAWWSRLRALDRFALHSLARRGRDDGLKALRAELGEPRST
ncbi:MAG: nitrate reductase associated protein [Sandaracinus sp.]